MDKQQANALNSILEHDWVDMTSSDKQAVKRVDIASLTPDQHSTLVANLRTQGITAYRAQTPTHTYVQIEPTEYDRLKQQAEKNAAAEKSAEAKKPAEEQTPAPAAGIKQGTGPNARRPRAASPHAHNRLPSPPPISAADGASGDVLAQILALQNQMMTLLENQSAESSAKIDALKAQIADLKKKVAQATKTNKAPEATGIKFVANAGKPQSRAGQRRPATKEPEQFSQHHLDVLALFWKKHTPAFSATLHDSDNIHAGISFYIPSKPETKTTPAVAHRKAFTSTPKGVTIHAPDHDDTLKASIILAVQMHQGAFKVISDKPGETVSPEMKERIRKIAEQLYAAGHLVDHNGNPFPNPVTMDNQPLGAVAPAATNARTATSAAAQNNARGTPAAATPPQPAHRTRRAAQGPTR